MFCLAWLFVCLRYQLLYSITYGGMSATNAVVVCVRFFLRSIRLCLLWLLRVNNIDWLNVSVCPHNHKHSVFLFAGIYVIAISFSGD